MEPEKTTDHVETETWRAVAVSVVGTAHLQGDRVCQDAFAIDSVGDTLLLFAADGAGSAARAEVGSRLAVDAALEAARAELEKGGPADAAAWTSLLETIIAAARERLEQEAWRAGEPGRSEQPADLGQFATTLLGVLASSGWLAALQVGDGWIVTERPDGGIRTLFQPARGEYFNEVTFLTSSRMREDAQLLVESRRVDGLAVITDGLELVAIDLATGAPHEPFFQRLLGFTRIEEPAQAAGELDSLLRSDRICERTDDDKTLILAVRGPRVETGSGDAAP